MRDTSIRRVSLLLTAAALTGATLAGSSAGAHPSHAAPMVSIQHPASGKLYVNGVPQAGGVDVGANTAVATGSTVPVGLAWECPAGSGGAVLEISIADATGAAAWNSGRASMGPSASHGWEWKPAAAGTYTITATLECYRFDNRTQPPTRISLGTDTDTRNALVTSI